MRTPPLKKATVPVMAGPGGLGVTVATKPTDSP